MFPSRRNQTKNLRKAEEPLLAASLRPENYLPGFVIGFLLGLFVDFAGARLRNPKRKSLAAPEKVNRASFYDGGSGGGDELKMVLVVRQDLKMGAGKIASQCARLGFFLGSWKKNFLPSQFMNASLNPRAEKENAATGMYAELLQSHRSLLRQWEHCGQPKIVVTCKNQQEMNRLKGTADQYGLPTFIVADAGRTQVQAGSKTVLAIGPGKKAVVDSVTGKQRLL